jgi:hypothetical protein
MHVVRAVNVISEMLLDFLVHATVRLSRDLIRKLIRHARAAARSQHEVGFVGPGLCR